MKKLIRASFFYLNTSTTQTDIETRQAKELVLETDLCYNDVCKGREASLSDNSSS